MKKNNEKVVLSYGMGADSTAILLEWLTNPASRDFALADLIVLTAQVGDEFGDTGRLCDEHIIPMLRAHNIRTVQVARKSASETDGYVVLEDSRQPTRFFVEGSGWTVRSEYLGAGTVPQAGGAHLCSIHFKGFALDRFLQDEFGGEHFRQVIGFEANEVKRKLKDRSFEAKRKAGSGNLNRTTEFPLIDEWDWDRQACLDRISELTGGVEWPKSCCVFCPFAVNRANLPRHLRRLADHPEQTADACVMERVSTALNPHQRLYKTKSIEDILEADGQHGEALRIRDTKLDEARWGVCEVRRAFSAGRIDGETSPEKKGPASRHIEIITRGTREEMAEELTRIADELTLDVEAEGRHERVWVIRRAESYPCREAAFVAIPALITDKKGPGFDTRWANAKE